MEQNTCTHFMYGPTVRSKAPPHDFRTYGKICNTSALTSLCVGYEFEVESKHAYPLRVVIEPDVFRARIHEREKGEEIAHGITRDYARSDCCYSSSQHFTLLCTKLDATTLLLTAVAR